MKKYLLISLGLMLVFLILFALFEVLPIPFLTDIAHIFDHAGIEVAVLGVVLLVVDVVLPVPSSVIMIANGALFGIVTGSLLSVAGSVGASALGFGLGRSGSPLLARFVTKEQQDQADSFLSKWGIVAIIVTRPIPILSETVTIVAGTTRMKWPVMLVASFAGAVPSAVLYALTGALALQLESFLLAFGLVLVVAAVFWAIGFFQMKRR